VLDLYCGMGALGLQLGDDVAWGVGIESNAAAIEGARANASRNGIEKWRFEVGDANGDLRPLELPGRPRLALVNPPRRGIAAATARGLAHLGIDRIIYVSCKPESLARDAMDLRGGGYRLVRAQPFDLFPQTHHVETVALFQREDHG
jgi:23S rRNA (uracil1939-C5)-methyltransferase